MSTFSTADDTVPGVTPATAAATAAPAARTGRLALLSGAAYVVAVLVGNALTESATGDGVLGDLEATATSTAARVGIVLELLAFVLLLVFVGTLCTYLRRTPASGVLAVPGAVMVSIKLGSGAELLAALYERHDLDEGTAQALVSENGAAFLLFWLPFGLFVVATAMVMAQAGTVGTSWRWSGCTLGTLTVLAGVVGAVDPDLAVPVPFLLSLLWVAALSVRLALGTGTARR
jgi:hypothetical protein